MLQHRERGQVCPKSSSENLYSIDDPVGSLIVEMLHHVEGGDVEQWLEPRNIFLCL